MWKIARAAGWPLFFGAVGMMLTVSCMRDRGGSDDFITKPYIKNDYYTDGNLFYDLDQQKASVIGTDGPATEMVVPNAISINDVIYPITRIKNLGVFTTKEYYQNHHGVTNGESLRSLTVGYNVNTFSTDDNENPLFMDNDVEIDEEHRLYYPYTYPRRVRRYSLQKISVWNGNTTFDAREDCNAIVLSNLNQIMMGGAINTIPSSIEIIGDFAFVNIGNILASPNSKSIIVVGESAFQNCGLAQMELPSTLEKIGRCAFANNYLRTLSIPASVSEIGDFAFYGNTLQTIFVEEGNKTFDSRNNCNAIIKKESDELIQGCDDSVIPESVVRIGTGAFMQCKTMSDVKWPQVLKAIKDYAFLECEALEKLDLPEGLDSIGASAFYGCSKLSEINIPSTVTFIGKGAFRNCTRLTRNGSYVKLHHDDPSKIDPSAFSFSDDHKVYQLMVPKGSLNLYQNSRWKDFFQEIDEFEE